MVKTISKSDFRQNYILSMKAGERVIVLLDEYLDLDRVYALCRITTRRFTKELEAKGIEKIQCEKAGENCLVVAVELAKDREGQEEGADNAN